jgi:hypothetical protein
MNETRKGRLSMLAKNMITEKPANMPSTRRCSSKNMVIDSIMKK